MLSHPSYSPISDSSGNLGSDTVRMPCVQPIRWIILASLCWLLAACAHGSCCEEPFQKVDESQLEKWEESSPLKVTHDVYVFPGPTNSPPVLLLHELPGLSPKTLNYAQDLSEHFTVYVPLLFGEANEERFFSSFTGLWTYLFNSEWAERRSLQGSRMVTQWLLGVVDKIKGKRKHRNQPIGVIGMCLTGAMPLALLGRPEVRAVVVAQPTLPLIGDESDLGISRQEWGTALCRVRTGEVKVFGVRFRHDTTASRTKHIRLKECLGAGFEDWEITDRAYAFTNRDGQLVYIRQSSHSTLTFEWCSELPEQHPVNVRRREVVRFLKENLGKPESGISSCPTTDQALDSCGLCRMNARQPSKAATDSDYCEQEKP